MRRVNRTIVAIPAEIQSAACTAHRTQMITNPATKAKSDLYRGLYISVSGARKFSVVETLKTLYKNKCAYCEKYAHAPKIDHHRPKGRVVGSANGNRGYYWLSYEWTNLLPTCTNCNELGAKGSKYPIRGARNNSHPIVGIPPSLNVPDLPYLSLYNTNEGSLLLHPEYCLPHLHFDFDRSGKIYGVTQEGRETINTIGLDNDDLNGWRRKIFDKYTSDLTKIILRHFRAVNPIAEAEFQEQVNEWTHDLVMDSLNIADEYTLFKRKLVKNIDYFFIDPLDTVYRSKTQSAISTALTLI